MAAITTTKPITLAGIGDLPAGVKISFKANFLEREQGVVCHSLWYKDQINFDAGVAIPAEIAGLSGGKDNITIAMSEFTSEELAVLAESIAIMQAKVASKLATRINDEDIFIIE